MARGLWPSAAASSADALLPLALLWSNGLMLYVAAACAREAAVPPRVQPDGDRRRPAPPLRRVVGWTGVVECARCSTSTAGRAS